MRRIVLGLVFLAIVASVAVSTHLYVVQRLVLDLALAPGLERALAGSVAVLAAMLVLAPIAEHNLPPRFARLVAWPAAFWLGFAFLLLVCLAASEIVVWLLGAAVDPVPAARGRAIAVLGVAVLLAATAARSALGPPALRRVEVRLPRWPRGLDGFRIVQISDIHIGATLGREFAQHVVDRVNALSPDLVAVTGDLVDGDVHHLRERVEPFAALRGEHGVYFVTGNHDYFSGVDPWVDRVRQLGMRVLRNERVTITRGGDRFDLAGVEDHRSRLYGGGRGEDLPRALEGRDPERAVVLLAHDPTTFREAQTLDVDLQLSGHTHGGQIWPFHFIVRLVIPWVAGAYRANGSQLYVSRGTGFWGPPLRLFAPAEITELTLRHEAA